MEHKIGQFVAYIPDQDLFQTLIGIFYSADLKEGKEIVSPSNKLHKFFYKMKKKFPKIFEDVYFNDDPEFPYSKEISEAFIRLQESEFLTRPNPSLNNYRINTDLANMISKAQNSTSRSIKEISDIFKKEFEIMGENTCGC